MQMKRILGTPNLNVFGDFWLTWKIKKNQKLKKKHRI
jgi:hypothetical protein